MLRVVTAIISLAAPAVAGDFKITSPIKCDLETDCYIQQYVDHDPGPNASDFHCGDLTYDGHKGTDFAVPTLARMMEGVIVVASASGTVRGVRDGMPDLGFTSQTEEKIKGRECGNGVVIVHENGWETQYCHLLLGSISVTKGQAVKAGDILGSVGMSGRAQFPHVHLSVRNNGSVVDPFDPSGEMTCETSQPTTLWDEPLPYRPTGIITMGISGGMPDYAAVKAGETELPNSTSQALVVFANVFGARAGDRLFLSIDGPDAEVISQTVQLKRDQATSFRGIGRKRRDESWPVGTYKGTATLSRDGEIIEDRALVVNLK